MIDGARPSFLGGRVKIKVGDITQQEVDAVVNAANTSLLGGGGVDGAIHRAGGPSILEECRRLRNTEYPDGLPTGGAVITTAGDLPARHVIHTVGPIYGRNQQGEAELLAACYENSLALAVRHSVTTIAFPAISTGIYGYPRSEAAAVASTAIKRFLADDRLLNLVLMIFFQERAAQVFLEHQRFER